MYEGAGSVKVGGVRVLLVAVVFEARDVAAASSGCGSGRVSTGRAWRVFPSAARGGEARWGGQARLPRHVFALVVRMMGSFGHDQDGLNQFVDSQQVWGSCRSSSSRLVVSEPHAAVGWREAADLAVA